MAKQAAAPVELRRSLAGIPRLPDSWRAIRPPRLFLRWAREEDPDFIAGAPDAEAERISAPKWDHARNRVCALDGESEAQMRCEDAQIRCQFVGS